MPDFSLPLAVSSLIAGFLMFLAPCTLPLIPAYIAFISGIKEIEAREKKEVRLILLKNASAFVLGFSFVFISLGLLLGYAGSLIGGYKVLLSQIGGIFIIIFGLMMLNVLKIPLFTSAKSFVAPKVFTPGNARSSFVVGTIFALGWTPCIGPVLASVLLFASISATALYGAFLLLLFSIGLAIPFIITALLFARMSDAIAHYSFITTWLSIIGGVFLVIIGILLVTSSFDMTLHYGTTFFEMFRLDGLLKFY